MTNRMKNEVLEIAELYMITSELDDSNILY